MKKLERNLGLLSVIAISISAMLGSELFILPGIAFAKTGNSVWLAYLIAASCALPACFSKSELATAMPTSGGTYVYLDRTFGPLIGTVAGLGLWFSILLKSAFALVGFSTYLKIMTDINSTITGLCLLLAIIILNILGTGKVSTVLKIVVIITFSSLIFFELNAVIFHFVPKRMSVLMPNNFQDLISAASLVFVSYAGVTKVAAIAEEIKDPEKNLPRGILLSLLIVAALYGSVTFILAGSFPKESLSSNSLLLYDFGNLIGNKWGGYVMAVVGILCMTSMANTGILAGSRFPFAMARAQLVPSYFGKLHSKYLTPVWSIIISGFIIGLAITFLDMEVIVKLGSAFLLCIYMAENFAVIVLRESRAQWYNPTYKSPLYPLMQVFGILTGLVLLSSMGLSIIGKCLGAIVFPGIIFYLLYGRKYTTRKGILGIRGPRPDLVKDDQPKRIEVIDLSVDAMVVVPLFGKERSPEMLIEMGAALADGKKLEIAHLTEIPEQTDYDDIGEGSSFITSLRRRVIAMAIDHKIPVVFDPIVTHDISKSIYTIGQRLHCRWLLIEWSGQSTGTFTLHNPLDWLRDHLNCNLAIFRDAGVRYIRKIMVIIDNNSQDDLVAETSEHLGQVHRAEVTLVQFIDSNVTDSTLQKVINNLENFKKEYLKNKEIKFQKDARDNEYQLFKEKEMLAEANSFARPSLNWSVKILKGKNKIETYIDASADFDLMVFGMQDFSRRKFFFKLFGNQDDQLTQGANCSVLKVKENKLI